jgi:enoyl-CoA hydratase/carnithine racemase
MTATNKIQDKPIALTHGGPVATLTLNRTIKRNAISEAMWRSIAELAGEVAASSSTRVMILRGVDETAFSAGADIAEFERVHASPEAAHAYREVVDDAYEAVAGLKIPTIAMIQGVCFGGGCALSLCCDFRYADTTSTFSIPPAKLGLVYSLKETKRLSDLVGPSKAKEMLMGAQVLDAEEALRVGLVNHLFEANELEDRTLGFARQLADLSSATIGAVKQMMHDIQHGAVSETENSRLLVEGQFASDDYIEGRNAFLEKRKPKFADT